MGDRDQLLVADDERDAAERRDGRRRDDEGQRPDRPARRLAAYSSWPASVDITWKDNGSTRSATTESIGQPSGGRLELEYSNGGAPNGSWQLTVTPAGGGATLLQGTVTRDC